MLASLSGASPLVAGEYVVTIGGSPGTRFGGTCLVIGGQSSANHDASGTVPFTLRLSGELISCAIQRKAGSGRLSILIATENGRVVEESSSTQPFGIVMAAGR